MNNPGRRLRRKVHEAGAHGREGARQSMKYSRAGGMGGWRSHARGQNRRDDERSPKDGREEAGDERVRCSRTKTSEGERIVLCDLCRGGKGKERGDMHPEDDLPKKRRAGYRRRRRRPVQVLLLPGTPYEEENPRELDRLL